MKHELRMLYSTQEQSNDGKRNTALDMARGFAIILIVIGHSSHVSGVPAVWLSTFHLPAFFLLSGWLSVGKPLQNEKAKSLLCRKVKTILVPYFWFSAGSLLLDLIQVWRCNFTWDTLLQHVVETVSLQGYSVMWFLPVFFLTQTMVDLLSQLLKKVSLKAIRLYGFSAILFTVCAILLYGVYHGVIVNILSPFFQAEVRIVIKAVIGAAFFCYGSLLSLAVKEIAPKGKKAKAALAVAGIFCMAVNVVAAFWCTLMDLNYLNLGNLPVYLLLGTTGSFGLVLLFLNIPNLPLLTFFGQNSLIIMCTHLNFYVMYFAIRITDAIAACFGNVSRPVWVVCMLVLTMFLEIPVILLVRICFPFVLGRARAQWRVSAKAIQKN